MKTETRQSQSRNPEEKRRSNRLKATLNLATRPNFGREYGEWEPGGNPAGYFTYNHLGYEIRLRYSQVSCEWTATCPHFNIKTSFPHQPPQDIQSLLNDWLLKHIESPSSPEAHIRQTTPAVRQFANRHGISPELADEMIFERGF